MEERQALGDIEVDRLADNCFLVANSHFRVFYFHTFYNNNIL
jgi:hypothetical protein